MLAKVTSQLKPKKKYSKVLTEDLAGLLEQIDIFKRSYDIVQNNSKEVLELNEKIREQAQTVLDMQDDSVNTIKESAQQIMELRGTQNLLIALVKQLGKVTIPSDALEGLQEATVHVTHLPNNKGIVVQSAEPKNIN